MFQLRRLTSIFAKTAAIAAITVLAPSPAAADSIPAILPDQISVTAGAAPILLENGGSKPYSITVKNISNQAIGINKGFGFTLTFVGKPDKSDKVVDVTETGRTCKQEGLAAKATCIISFNLFPDNDGPEKENTDSGITTIKFTVIPNRGGPVSASADVTVEDHAQVPEPTTLTSLISALISLAGIGWLHRVSLLSAVRNGR